ncbi:MULTISPECIES: toprim domain-containing protein [Peptostreptococcaceae]|uniref:toprim domain-containing protein n=1 Tax=Peptostreptococcaceae TaxID=186804 RepID=UPI000820B1E0|nr:MULTISPECIES: toprim domain-containing protein [Peptostreptococcaceae]SCI50497.1 DNA primase (bacterial type) [uncultured Clostridium sp.]MCE4921896.1 toprim domain-containing protein [Clostridioides difficile]MCH1964636.1 toprim domain-containing protein [Paeniclostridium sordellii]MDM0309430.1 toprim domain-containing protein [Clostridioides difficile]MDM0378944.1 toprim domain-containing protein [Clostridioides difficile]
MIKDDLLKQANSINIEYVLNHYGIHKADSYNRYRCISPYHTDNNPSASIDKSRNKLKCFTCNRTFTSIDVVSTLENNDNLRECAKKVMEISNVTFVAPTTDAKVSKGNKAVKEDGKRKLTIQDRKNLIVKDNLHILEDYLLTRGINSKIVFPILNRNGVVYGVDRYEQPTFIFEKFGVCIFRYTKENENRVTGRNVPVSIVSDSSNKEWWIVEGIYDALTLLNLKKNVICLNTTNNVDAFIEKISSNKTKINKFNYIVATDNDDAGLTAKATLEDFFNKNDIKYKNFDRLYNSKYKDVNDMRKNCKL